MAEITSPDYPGERLIACCNPFLAAERAWKRCELLDATEAELKKIAAATRRARGHPPATSRAGASMRPARARHLTRRRTSNRWR